MSSDPVKPDTQGERLRQQALEDVENLRGDEYLAAIGELGGQRAFEALSDDRERLCISVAALADALADLEKAWIMVRGCVPQYADSSLTPESLLHGVRQLAAMFDNECVLRQRDKEALAEKEREVERLEEARNKNYWDDAVTADKIKKRIASLERTNADLKQTASNILAKYNEAIQACDREHQENRQQNADLLKRAEAAERELAATLAIANTRQDERNEARRLHDHCCGHGTPCVPPWSAR